MVHQRQKREKLHCECVVDGSSFLMNPFDILDKKPPSRVIFFLVEKKRIIFFSVKSYTPLPGKTQQ